MRSRKKIAMGAMEIIPSYQGILIHDHWTPYNKYINLSNIFKFNKHRHNAVYYKLYTPNIKN